MKRIIPFGLAMMMLLGSTEAECHSVKILMKYGNRVSAFRMKRIGKAVRFDARIDGRRTSFVLGPRDLNIISRRMQDIVKDGSDQKCGKKFATIEIVKKRRNQQVRVCLNEGNQKAEQLYTTVEKLARMTLDASQISGNP